MSDPEQDKSLKLLRKKLTDPDYAALDKEVGDLKRELAEAQDRLHAANLTINATRERVSALLSRGYAKLIYTKSGSRAERVSINYLRELAELSIHL